MMIEIQCPECGEYVSDELDVCPFCQASLTPMEDRAEKDGNDPISEDAPLAGEVVVNDVGDQEPPLEPERASTIETTPAEAEVTDWLSGLERTASEEDKAPAWLSKLADDSKKEAQPASESDGTVDWLDGLRDDSETKETFPAEEALQESAEEPISQEGIPDWMKKLQEDVDSRSSASGQVQADPSPLPNTDTPDWLLRLQAETQAYASARETSLSSREDETPEIPEKTTSVENKPTGAELPPEDETADWLKEIEDEAVQEVVPGPSAEDDSPDWLKDIRPDDKVLAGEEPASSDEIRGELDSSLSETSPTSTTADLSDPKLPVSGEELSPNGTEPDWLINLKAEGEASQQEEGGQLKTPISAHQDDLELVPGWLQGLEKEEPLSSETSVPAMDEPVVVEPGVAPTGDLPDWLIAMQADAEAPAPKQDQPPVVPDASGMAPADLPTWVQEMQPVEAMMAGVEVPENELTQITENDGPLAGLAGVLPVAPVFGGEQKPQNFSARLRITEDQKQKASQLEQMLADENQARPVSHKANNSWPRILRWVVSLLLVAAILIPAIGAVQITPELAACPPEVLATSQLIFGLPPSSPVLLVFDYEPAYSGELEAVAAPLVSNLLLTGARLATLSTSPTGPALAEYFMKTTQAQVISLNSQQVTELGYLAGGASGILSFATHPSQTMPYALDGSQPWQSGMLQDVNALSDFAALIILTDNSDTARMWVEQAGPLLGGKPMLMAISAQAEPMLRPYYDSHQVQGLVAGLAGGKAYEQALALPGLAKHYWNSFSFGLLFAELVIGLAILWSLVSMLRDRQPAQKEEE